jgi:MFS family permease
MTLGGSVGTVGQARLITAGVAVATSIVLSPALWVFLGAHLPVGLAFACLLSAGFAGVAAFSPNRRAWAIGYVAGANAPAWIVVNPIVGAVTDWLSWRAAQAVPRQSPRPPTSRLRVGAGRSWIWSLGGSWSPDRLCRWPSCSPFNSE